MVEEGFLAPNAVPLTPETNKGINVTWRGRAHLISGVTQAVYVKFLSRKQLVNELLAAELGRLMGFQVPDSYLLHVQKSDYPAEFTAMGITDASVNIFGCKDMTAPTLGRRYKEHGPGFLKWFVDSCAHWKSLVAFDGWIGNIDRHFDNLLISTSDSIWLIDHGHCFTGAAWTEPDLDPPDRAVTNRLIDELSDYLSPLMRLELVSKASEVQKLAGPVHVQGAMQDCWVSAFLQSTEFDALSLYVEHRREKISALVSASVGIPQLNL